MGKGETSTTTGNTPRSASSSSPNDGVGGPEEEFWALLVSIFDHCGLFGFRDNGSKDPPGLRHSLIALLSKVKRFNGNSDDPWMNDNSKGDIASALLTSDRSNDDSFLLELEQCLHQVRTNASLFVQTKLTKERNDVIALRDELFDLCSSSATNLFYSRQWFILAQTIIAHFINQLSLEESLIHRKLYPLLDSMYETNIVALKAPMQQLIHGLARSAFLECIPYLQASEQLEKYMNASLNQTSISLNRSLPRMEVSPSLISKTVVTTTKNDTKDNTSAGELAPRSSATITIPPAIHNDVLSFCNFNCEEGIEKVRAVLVTGAVGSGKTYLCHKVEQLTRSLQHSSLFVIQPRLPIDLLQGRVGETEDVLVSMLEAIQRHEARNVLVLLDDLEHIIGGSGTDLESHFVRRCRSTFFALFDSLHRMLLQHSKNVLFICTTSIPKVVHVSAVRFDRVIQLEPPNALEREHLIRFYFPTASPFNDAPLYNVVEKENNLVKNVVESTVGKSFAELVQLCRQSVEALALLDPPETDDMASFNQRALTAMKERLQTVLPESLRSEYVDGYVDLRVWSARDLLQQLSFSDPFNTVVNYECRILESPSASVAWKVLQSSIIIPLCKSKELRQLMDSSVEVAKSMVGAVLLTGEPGSGKSALALHCARHAATLLPSMKLMEVTCTSLVHKEVGASEQAIQHLFAAARRAAPAIVLMDGIETIAATRGNDATTEGTMDRILSTLLIELDGIDGGGGGGGSAENGIAVIGITRDASWIDPALKRPGRFDRVLHLSQDWC